MLLILTGVMNDYVEVDNSSGSFDLTQMSFSTWVKPEWVSNGPTSNPGFLGIRGAIGVTIFFSGFTALSRNFSQILD